ncbi:FkbM family methyltransferase [Halorhabdus sp. SVX81]|uniref:FkbM family methyltransferase n=1 Tax=Halorhabdus sp. SVX81 TaxID=2978283 RepID=UPI0023DA34F5|nr:FkbM family methyltransferase [Halorhabdus sp. SVX81]
MYRRPVQNVVRSSGLEKYVIHWYNRLLRDGTVTHTVDGVKAEFHNTSHIPHSLPERSVVEDVFTQIRQGDVFYDFGANRGLFTCMIARMPQSPTVISFEPSPDAFSDLQRNVELNEIGNSVSTHQLAVSDTSGEISFVVKDESTGNTLVSDVQTEADEIISVPSVEIDSFVTTENIPLPTVIKIDVEGAELQALQGMVETLQEERCRLIYCEVHEEKLTRLDQNPEDLFSILRECGFETIKRVYDRSDSHYIVRGEKSHTE